MDTCIAIRTMTFKDGIAYLQAGGGIVYDSVEEDEYIETINKLGGNVKALATAERKHSVFEHGLSLRQTLIRLLATNSAESSPERLSFSRYPYY